MGKIQSGNSEVKKELSPRKVAAIKRTVKLGEKLRSDCPQLALNYRQGGRIIDIAKRLDIAQTYNVTERISEEAVRLALQGYTGGLGDHFDGLLRDSEIERLRHEHRIREGRRRHREGVGIFSLNEEERRAKSSEIGSSCYRLKRGIWALSPEERQEASFKGIRAQGKVPWIGRKFCTDRCQLAEKEFAHMLWKSPSYRHASGTHSGKPNWSLIAQRLNEVYHHRQTVRNTLSTQHTLARYINSLPPETNENHPK